MEIITGGESKQKLISQKQRKEFFLHPPSPIFSSLELPIHAIEKWEMSSVFMEIRSFHKV